MSANNDQDGKLSARERRLALEKQMAGKGDAGPAKAPKAAKTKAAKNDGSAAPSDGATKGKGRKILKWGGISVGALIVLLFGGVGMIWLSSGSTYEHDLKTLAPTDALLVIEFNDLGSQLEQVDQRMGELYENRNSVNDLERSAFWREEFKVSLRALHNETIKGGLESARQTLAGLPIELTLEKDILGKQTVIALVPDSKGEESHSLIMTRVSREVAFGWSFRTFGEGQHGTATIGAADDFLTISGGASDGAPTLIGLFDDVLAISSSMEAMTALKARHQAGAGAASGFAALPLLKDAQEKLAEVADTGVQGPVIKAFANLDAIRDFQGKDPEDPAGRAPIDTYFSPSRQVMTMSAEIMPTLSNVLDHSIDTRLYKMAAWNLRLTPKEGILADQFLIAPEGDLANYPKVATAMKAEATDLRFLKLLPQGAWLVATMRQPITEIRKATKPALDAEGKEKPSAIYSFMKAMESDSKGSEPVSIGMALLSERFTTLTPKDQRSNRAKTPPNIISKIPFPPFVLFLDWPGVKDEDVERLLTLQLSDIGAKETRLVKRIIDGQVYYAIFNGNVADEGTQGFLNNIAAAAIDGHLIFAYGGLDGRRADDMNGTTGWNSVIKAISDLATSNPITNEVSMQKQLNDVWAQSGDKHNALVYFNAERFLTFENNVGLTGKLAESKFDPDAPFGMSTTAFRRQVAKDLGLSFEDPRVTTEFRKRIDEWLADKPNYIRELQGNLRALNFVEDFTAQTVVGPEVMHTRFIIRLGR